MRSALKIFFKWAPNHCPKTTISQEMDFFQNYCFWAHCALGRNHFIRIIFNSFCYPGDDHLLCQWHYLEYHVTKIIMSKGSFLTRYNFQASTIRSPRILFSQPWTCFLPETSWCSYFPVVRARIWQTNGHHYYGYEHAWCPFSHLSQTENSVLFHRFALKTWVQSNVLCQFKRLAVYPYHIWAMNSRKEPL